jgi:hypothetical protein
MDHELTTKTTKATKEATRQQGWFVFSFVSLGAFVVAS